MLQDRRVSGYLIEMFNVMSNRESINLVKPCNIRKNVEIYGQTARLRGNSLHACAESLLVQE